MLKLIRYEYTSEETLGLIFDEKGYICDTLELPWRYNESFVSCISLGTYSITYREDSQAHVPKGYLFEDVPGRSEIFIHPANYVRQLEGCIAVGTKCLNFISESKDGFQTLRNRVGDSSQIVIMNLE